MFRDREDHDVFVNLMALQSFSTGTEILADAACSEGDYLNTGYCAWFLGHRQEAIRIFKEHVKNLHGKMDNDTRLFDLYGISHAERQMIADIYLS